MNKGGWLLTWLVSVVIAGYLGYLLGNAESKSNDVNDSSRHSAVTPTVDEQSSRQIADSFANRAELPDSEGQNPDPFEAAIREENTASLPADETLSRERGQKLDDLGQAFARAGEQASTHNELRRDFSNRFDEHDLDFESQTHFTDFIQLHERADAIELHQIACAVGECQLLGQFEGDHEAWEAILEEMKEQDWWTYQGTSSSSSTRDGVTYFNLYVDKGQSGD